MTSRPRASARGPGASGRVARGVRALTPKSFARIHRANLINWGIVPLEFQDAASYEGIQQGDRLKIEGLRARLAVEEPLTVLNARSGAKFTVRCPLTPRERDILLAGGLLPYTKAAPLHGLNPPPPPPPPSGGEDKGEGGRV